MLISKHLFFGTLFSLILFLIFPNIGILGFFLIILSTFFIDTDHYLFYVYRKKDLNLRRAYNFFVERSKKRRLMSIEEKKNIKYEILIFHGIEFGLILSLLTMFFGFFAYILIGVMFHIFLDWIELIIYNSPIYFKFSQTYTFIKNKN